ncbi:hypothetical protein [Paraflavitalea pollutisoli]|uniref:hypothetical protein n=1 Tax=Paraflavitalea pollutisoli TaxID=3034143 RepID=UPI0023EC4A47|nr:hypothetical protein [Paraflavitalea sp. H1-2-19X]
MCKYELFRVAAYGSTIWHVTRSIQVTGIIINTFTASIAAKNCAAKVLRQAMLHSHQKVRHKAAVFIGSGAACTDAGSISQLHYSTHLFRVPFGWARMPQCSSLAALAAHFSLQLLLL